MTIRTPSAAAVLPLGDLPTYERGGGARTTPLFQRAKGCRSMEVRRFVEMRHRYHLLVQWDTLENHTVDFRGSEDFQKWRGCVGHCFSAPPEVYHTVETVHGF